MSTPCLIGLNFRTDGLLFDLELCKLKSVCDEYSNILEYFLPNTGYSNTNIEIYTNNYIRIFEKIALQYSKI